MDHIEILKNNFPNLSKRGLVISVNEFLLPQMDLKDFICIDRTPKEAAVNYILAKVPYIVMDESEGYKCLFFRGNYIQAQYDATHAILIRYREITPTN